MSATECDFICEKLKKTMNPLPKKVFFYVSRLMRCAEEQYKAIFFFLKKNIPQLQFVFSYEFPPNMKNWNNDRETLYVLTMNVRELTSMLHSSDDKLPVYYIWWQTEQFSNSRFFSNPTWMRALGNSVWLWDYAQPNVDYLKKQLPNTTVTFVPHGFCSSMLFSPLHPDTSITKNVSAAQNPTPTPLSTAIEPISEEPPPPEYPVENDIPSVLMIRESEEIIPQIQEISEKIHYPQPISSQIQKTTPTSNIQMQRAHAIRMRKLAQERHLRGLQNKTSRIAQKTNAQIITEKNIPRVVSVIPLPKTVPFDSNTFSVPTPSLPGEPPWDVLFLGAVCGPQRMQAIHILKNKYHLKILMPRAGKYWYAEEREKQIRLSKVCFNVHYFRDPSVLETARLNILLMNGSVIVSEHSTAQNGIMDKRYEESNSVVFVPQGNIDDLCKRCAELCKDNSERKLLQQRAIDFSHNPDHQIEKTAKIVLEVFQKLFI